MDQYVLENKIPVKTGVNESNDIINYVKTIKEDVIGNIRVSTIFLSFDHGFIEDQPPILFETMVFGGKFDQCQTRYSTYAEAENGHEKVLNKVIDNIDLLNRIIFWLQKSWFSDVYVWVLSKGN